MLYVSQKQRSCSHFVLIHIHYSVDDQSFLPQYFQPKTLYITTSFSLLYFYDYKPYKETWLQGSSWEQLDGVPNLMGGGGGERGKVPIYNVLFQKNAGKSLQDTTFSKLDFFWIVLKRTQNFNFSWFTIIKLFHPLYKIRKMLNIQMFVS